jgi:rhodanese-related sulfurtransferase
MDRLPADKTLVFYCHSGARSMVAAAMMDEEGFDGPLHNLAGGLMAWEGGRWRMNRESSCSLEKQRRRCSRRR